MKKKKRRREEEKKLTSVKDKQGFFHNTSETRLPQCLVIGEAASLPRDL